VEKGTTAMTRATVTQKSSGNIFLDLAFSDEKSVGLILKSNLLQDVQDTVKSRGWKQVEAAVHLGIDQAEISKLMAGENKRNQDFCIAFSGLLGTELFLAPFPDPN
jgi:predicted XRE-type DNA-binding protein